MSSSLSSFQAVAPLLEGLAHPACRACVTIPARNEEACLPQCLERFSRQFSVCGPALPPHAYEVLLLLNNCTDGSAEAARAWRREHPWVVLHVLECTLPENEAHVGTARRLLMDTAWHRLRGSRAHPCAILSTDADTEVPPDWIGENLRALERGADVVGGSVEVPADRLNQLPSFVRYCYRQDRQYARLLAQLEHVLDPREGDAWPRHLDHFGSSLACTPQAYAAAGGMPVVSPLEDEAFVDRVRRANLILRHEPRVHVATSARLEGRAVVGLAGQLRLWSELRHEDAHTVASAEFVAYRFRFLARLREIFATKNVGDLPLPTPWWKDTFQDALAQETSCPGFLAAIYCDILICESFQGPREEPIRQAIAGLRSILRTVTAEGRQRSGDGIGSTPEKDVRGIYAEGMSSSSVQ